MLQHLSKGGWLLEIEAVRVIQTDEYGKPYTATVTLKNIDGHWFATNMLKSNGTRFSLSDRKAIENLVKEIGIEKIQFSRFNQKLSKRELTICTRYGR